MKIKVISAGYEIEKFEFKDFSKDFIIIVIDVLRASSTIVTALYWGANCIIPISSVSEAEKIRKKYKLNNSLLCGEENGVKIEGFDLGNSPLEFKKELIKEKILLMKTTNGTRILRECYKLFKNKNIYIASFLNIIFIIEKVKKINKDVLIVCSGSENNFSLEDFGCAGLILNGLEDYETDDFSKVSKFMIKYFNNDYKKLFLESFHGKNLLNKGFEEDLKFCSDVGIFNIAPIYKNGVIYPFEV